MLIINKPRLPPIHLNRPTAAFEPDSAAPRLVLRLQWACFGGLVGRLGLLMIQLSQTFFHQFQKFLCPSRSKFPEFSKASPTFYILMILKEGMAKNQKIKKLEKLPI